MPSPTVYDRSSGQIVHLPDDQVAQGLADGSLALGANAGPVTLQGQDGSTYAVAPDQVADALATGSYGLLGHEAQIRHDVRQTEAARGFGGSVAEALGSGINQALLGIPDAIAEAGETPDERIAREEREHYHAAARFLGGAVGFAGTALAGGGLFKSIESAGALAAEGILPAVEMADAGLATRLAAKAVNFGVQGALLSSPQALIQATIGKDPKRAAETLMWGIGLGAALGGAGELLSTGVQASGEAATSLLGDHLADFARDRTAKAIGATRTNLNPLSTERIGELTDYAHETGLIQPGMSRADIGQAVHAAHERVGARIGDAIDSLDGLFGKDGAEAAAEAAPEALDGYPSARDLDTMGVKNFRYLRSGMRPESLAGEQAKFAEVGADNASAYASGELGTAIDGGKPMRPVEVSLYPGEAPSLADGRHRMTAAIDAGADKILARVTKYDADMNELDSELRTLSLHGGEPDAPEVKPLSVPKDVQADVVARAIRPEKMAEAIRSALDGPELRMPMHADEARALDLVTESALKLPTITVNGEQVVPFRAAQDFVSSLRGKWVGAITRAQNEGGVRGMETVTALDQMKLASYQVARDYLHAAADNVATAADRPDLVRELANAKAEYSKVAELEKWVATRERQEAGNRMIGITDFMHAGHGPASGIAAAAGAGLGALAGPAGAMVGHGIGHAAGFALDLIAKHWMEDKGLVYLSTIAQRAAKDGPGAFTAVLASEGAKRLAATLDTVGTTMRRMAQSGFARTSGGGQNAHLGHLLGAGGVNGLSTDQQQARLEKRLTDLMANPSALTQVTSALAAPISEAHPELGALYQQQLATAIAYLYGALPKSPTPPSPYSPPAWSASPEEKLAFRDRAEMVASPIRALEHVERGTLSDAHMDALQAVYPSGLAAMRDEVQRWGIGHPEAVLPLAERTTVSRFLGLPLDAISDPSTIALLQSAYAPSGSPSPQGGGGTNPKPAPSRMGKMPSSASAFSATMASGGAPSS